MQRLALIEKKIYQSNRKSDFIDGSIPLQWVYNGIIIWAKQSELNLLGYAKERFIGMPITIHYNDGAIIRYILHRLINNETVHDVRATLKVVLGRSKMSRIQPCENVAMVHKIRSTFLLNNA